MQELQWQILKTRIHSRHGSVYSRDKCAKNYAYILENVVVYRRNTLHSLLQWLYYMVDIIQILLADGHGVYQQESQEFMGQHIVLWA